MIYDRNITINNIKRLMREKHITQHDLAKSFEGHQSRVSKCLNCDGDFTVPQLVTIASLLNVSLDSLIGSPQEKTQNMFKTYSDVFSFLFSLDRLFDVGIMDIMASDISDPDSFDVRFDTIVSQAIEFGDKAIIKVLKEWKAFLKIRGQVEDWEELFEAWKEGVLSRYNVEIKMDTVATPSTNVTEHTNAGNRFMDIPDKELPFA